MKHNTLAIWAVCPELANMANIPMTMTPAGWRAAHGQVVPVGAILQRPATKEEIASKQAKADYQDKAMKLGEKRRAECGEAA